MKELKFAPNLRSIILTGEKYATWRLDDDHDIQVGETISFVGGGQEFAKAKVESTKDVTFSNMTDDDKLGHEKYPTDEIMYSTFKEYYNKEVGPNTLVKIIKYKIL